MKETLHSAASRALRNFRIDMAAGGIMTRDTLHAMDTLDRALRSSPLPPTELTEEEAAQAERWRNK